MIYGLYAVFGYDLVCTHGICVIKDILIVETWPNKVVLNSSTSFLNATLYWSLLRNFLYLCSFLSHIPKLFSNFSSAARKVLRGLRHAVAAGLIASR